MTRFLIFCLIDKNNDDNSWKWSCARNICLCFGRYDSWGLLMEHNGIILTKLTNLMKSHSLQFYSLAISSLDKNLKQPKKQQLTGFFCDIWTMEFIKVIHIVKLWLDAMPKSVVAHSISMTSRRKTTIQGVSTGRAWIWCDAATIGTAAPRRTVGQIYQTLFKNFYHFIKYITTRGWAKKSTQGQMYK